jgi:very-short-patch-repair endonuclease
MKRKDLRNNSTLAEVLLWKQIKGKQLGGFKFRRQHSVSNYILDFYCPEVKLAIELDGQHHFSLEGKELDKIRDEYLGTLGIEVVRIENKIVLEQMSWVLDTLENKCIDLSKNSV